MPKNPGKKQAKISRKISLLRREGVPQKEAIARAIKRNERKKK